MWPLPMMAMMPTSIIDVATDNDHHHHLCR